MENRTDINAAARRASPNAGWAVEGFNQRVSPLLVQSSENHRCMSLLGSYL
jgi:hypothetical protein